MTPAAREPIRCMLVRQKSGLIVLAFAPVDVVPDMDRYSTTGLITSCFMPLSGPLRNLRIRMNLSSSSSVRPNLRPACAAASPASLALLNGPIQYLDQDLFGRQALPSHDPSRWSCVSA